MPFLEDAKGTRYDTAGNVIPPQEQAISDALTTARAETYDPYAQEVASAKRLMADQAQQNQSWSDWASDVGSNLYNSGMALLPTALGGKGEVGLTDIAKGVYESGKSAVTLPGDVLSGQTKVFDPASGNLTDEVLRRGMDFTGFMTLGAGAIPAEANTLRMGAKGIPEAPEPVQRPEPPSVENAALKAAQEATGGDDVAAATRAAQIESLNPVPPPQGVAAPEHSLGTQRAARTVISPTSIKLTPTEQAVVNRFQSRADRAMVASRIRETKARYPKSDGWSPFEAIGAEIDEKGNPVIKWQEQKYGFNTAMQPGMSTQVDPVTGEKIKVPVVEERALRVGTPEYERAANKATRNGVKAVEDIVRRAAEGDEAALKIIRQAGWYREFMRKGFDERGGSYPAFSDLLGATSPNTAVDQNYRYAVDVQNRFARGDFDDPVKFASEYTGSLNAFPEGKLIFRDPVGPKGPQKLQYGMNSRNAQMALADRWRQKEPGQAPKARNFSGNLGGATDEATIDVWAARFVNRMAGRKRLPPPVESGVKGKLGSNLVPTGEFGYGQDVFRRITDELNRKGNVLPYLKELGYDSLTPMDMQALTWFIEKEHWTKNNWTTAAGEGGSFEDELLKYPSERWQSGVSIQQSDAPTDAAMAYTRNVFENSLRDDPSVNQFRVHPTIGRYAGNNERSFDLELTAKPGWNPRTWMAAVIREAQANNQYDVFFSKRLSPEQAANNPNARPGVEIYFRDRKTLDEALPILEEFTKRNADGFTFVTDLRLRERELGGKEAPDFVGVRMQWVPEIRSRWDEEFRSAVEADPAVLDATADEALDAMQAALLALDRAGLGVVDARVHHYDTLTVGKESYDKFLDGIADPENAAGAYEGRTGAAVDPVRRFGQPLYSHVEGRNRALREGSEGGQSDAGGDVVGAGQSSGALERAQQQGFTTEAYRGSNRDIQEYGPSASETGYYGGKPTYFTNLPEDATFYTRVPVEEFEVTPYDMLDILQETNPNATIQDVLGGKGADLAEEHVNRILGGENLGTIYPSKLRMQNPVRVGGEGETVFQGSKAADIVKITAETLAERGVPEQVSISILSKLDEMLQADGFGAMDFDMAVRTAARSADRQMTNKIGSILTDIYQKAGFDSIDLDASVFGDGRSGGGSYYSYKVAPGTRHYLIFDPENIRGRFAKFGGIGPEGPAYMKAMGGAVDEEDIDNALRIARATGGRTSYAEAGSVPVMMEDAKGNKYDTQGNVIPPTNPGPNPQRSDMTPEQVGRQAAQDPATYDALMERYAIPDRDIAEYEAMRTKVAQQPQDVRQMTHLGDRPTREVTVDMPLFGGEYSMGRAPYDVASGMQGAAQTAYDLKTVPLYFTPAAPVAAGLDLAEGLATGDPVQAALAIAGGPGGKLAKGAGIGAVGYGMDPAEAQAGPERWFSKLFRAAEALPMEKMTGEQALAMLRKSAPQEEIRWTGLENFASENPVTTKKALLDFIQRNQVRTQDVVLGGGTKPFRREDVVPDEEIKAQFRDRMAAAQKEFSSALSAIGRGKTTEEISAAEAMAFQAKKDIRDLEAAVIDAQIEKMGGLGQPTRYGPGTRYEQYNTLGGEDYRETLVTLPSKEPLFKSGHWEGIPDIVGHIRTQMLTANPPGANRPLRLFNVDEAQSDWAQAGRKEGFKNQEAIAQVAKMREEINQNLARSNEVEARLRAEHYARIKPIQDARAAAIEEVRQRFRRGEISASELNILAGDTYNEFSRQIDPYADQYRRLIEDQVTPIRNRVSELGKDIERIGSKIGRMPEAPYVTSTQGWTDFSIKKALDQAIDSGADYFTFTPGEVQAARYGLQKHLDTVNYNPRTGALSAYDPDGRVVFDEDVLDEDLDQYVGQEIAERIRQKAKDLPVDEDSLRSRGSVRLTGVDLKTGGEGMIDYYNNIYKKRVEKVVKDLTGKKVQWEVLPAETAEGIVPRLGFRIDDDLREAKFPTFASGGTVSRALELTRDY